MNRNNKIDQLTVAELTPEKFDIDYLVVGRPVVITDFIASSVDWDLDFLCANLGDDEWMVRDYGSGHFDKPRYQWMKYCDHIKITIHTFAEHIRDGSGKARNLYLAQNPIGDTAAAKSISKEMQFLTQNLNFKPATPEASLNLWLGAAGHSEPLHFDPSDGTLMLLHGKKRVVLFPPRQTKNLYPFGFYDILPFWVSQVDVDQPDLNVHPQFSQAEDERYEVTLSPGQLLFIPTHWWHEVVAEGEGYVCSCNFFWKVRPFKRNFQTLQSTVLWAVNRFPWHWVIRFNRFIYQLKNKQ